MKIIFESKTIFAKTYTESNSDTVIQIIDTKNEYLVHLKNLLKKVNPYYKFPEYSVSKSFNVIHKGEKKDISTIIINKSNDNIHNIDDLLQFLNTEFKFLGNIIDETFTFTKKNELNENETQIVSSNQIVSYCKEKGFMDGESSFYFQMKFRDLRSNGYHYSSNFEYEVNELINSDSNINVNYSFINKTEYSDIEDYLFFINNNENSFTTKSFLIKHFLKLNYSENHFIDTLLNLFKKCPQENEYDFNLISKKMGIYNDVLGFDFLYRILFVLLDKKSEMKHEDFKNFDDVYANTPSEKVNIFNLTYSKYENKMKDISNQFFDILVSDDYQVFIEMMLFSINDKSLLLTDDGYSKIKKEKEQLLTSQSKINEYIFEDYENCCSILELIHFWIEIMKNEIK